MTEDPFDQRIRDTLASLSFEKRVPLDQVLPREEPPARAGGGRRPASTAGQEGPSGKDLLFLADIINRPSLNTTERTAGLGLSASSVSLMKRRLLEQGFVRERKFSSAGKGAAWKLLDPAEDGLACLGLSLGEYQGQGGFLHRWYQARLCALQRALGENAEIEFNRRGKRADVGYESDSGPVAIEIEMSAPGGADNICKDLLVGFVRVDVYTATTEIRDEIGHELAR